MKALITLLACVVSFQIWGQAPAIEWDKTYGSSNFDFATSLVKTQDGGFLMGGQDAYTGDFMVIKVDALGNQQWKYSYDNNGNGDLLTSIAANIDGGFVLGGTTTNPVTYESDLWIVKISTSGAIEWTVQLGGNGEDSLESLQIDAEGNILAGGTSNSMISGDKTEDSRGDFDMWVVKLNNNGDKIWDKTIGGSAIDLLTAIRVTTSGDYLLCGYSYSNTSGEKSEDSRGDMDYWVVRLDMNGNKLWDKTLGGSAVDVPGNLIDLPSGEIVVVGGSNSPASGDKSQNTINQPNDFDYWIVKLTSAGQKIWDKDFGGSDSCNEGCWRESAGDVAILNNDILIAGNSISNANDIKSENNRGTEDIWLIKIDNNGEILWDKTIGGDKEDQFFSNGSLVIDNSKITFLAHSNSGVTGDKTSPALGNGDFWLVSLVREAGDETPPVITGVPQDISAVNDPGSCYVSVSWTPPTATDNISVESFTSNHEPGDLFSYGATLVTYVATDASGNKSKANFYIYVQDNEAPIFAYTPDDIIAEIAFPSCSAFVELPEVVAIDNCEDVFIFGSRSDGNELLLTDPFPIGVTTITFEAYDLAENKATISFTVTVVDTQSPTFNTEDVFIEMSAQPGQCNTLVDLPVVEASDNCGVTVTKLIKLDGTEIPDPGNLFAVGTTTILYTATDVSDNKTYLTITIIIKDTEAPVVADPSPIVTEAIDGECYAIIDFSAKKDATPDPKENQLYSLPFASDNCGIASFTNDNGSDLFPVGETIITWTIEDMHGNISLVTQTIIVKDVTPPTIQLPENITLSGCDVTASWETPQTEDACGIATIVQTGGPVSGSNFEGGTTTIITYTATDASGNQAIGSFTVSRDPELVVTPTVTAGTCQNGNLGTASVKVIGGKEPYSYLWSTGATTAFVTNLKAGDYSVKITDAHQCGTTTAITIGAEICSVVKDLNLTSECYEDPSERRWRITNPNDFDVVVTWIVSGTNQTGTITTSPGLTYFTTVAKAGANTTIIKWKNEKGETKQVTKASSNKPCCSPSATTKNVISFDQGKRKDGKNVPAHRSNPEKALGEANAKDSPCDGIQFVSLGFGGSITLEFDQSLCDNPGDDLRVYETTYGNPSFAHYPEQAEVFVSQDGVRWQSLGRTNTTTPALNCRVKLDTDFDINGKFPWIKFVRVVDVTNPDAYRRRITDCKPLPAQAFNKVSDGFDLDAVETLNDDKKNHWSAGRTLADNQKAESTLITNPTALIYPNPVEQELMIDLEEEEELAIMEDVTIHLEIIDMKGTRLQTSNHNLDDGWIIRSDVSSLIPGMYIARTHLDGITRAYKFVKK